jgi:TPR repeat protein
MGRILHIGSLELRRQDLLRMEAELAQSRALDSAGDALAAKSDLAEALKKYREALAIEQRLATRDPSNATRQEDQAKLLVKSGDIYRQQGELSAAIEEYRSALAIHQRLAASDPGRAEPPINLVRINAQIGDALLAAGRPIEALESYGESLTMAETLVVRDPSRLDLRRLHETALLKTGDVLMAQHQYHHAIRIYERGAARGNAVAARMLGLLAYQGLGMPQDNSQALAWFTRAADLGDVVAQNNLGMLYETGRGVAPDYAKARWWYERAVEQGDQSAINNLESLAIREAEGAGRYAVASRLREAQVARVEARETLRDGKPGNETVATLHGLSWAALLAHEYARALAAAERARAIQPGNLVAETNRAHALMLLGRDEEARAIYVANRGKSLLESGNLLWERVIADDFQALRNGGVTHPMMSEIEAAFNMPRSSPDRAIPKEATHVLIRDVLVRQRPSADAPVTMRLAGATQVRVVEYAGEWAVIARDGQKLGYVPVDACLALR